MATGEFSFDSTSLEPIKGLALRANFAETKAWLQDALAPYAGLVVSEDAISEAKSDKAKINKLKNSIESVRKEVKRQYTAPLEIFESECKQLTGLCDNAYQNINSQVSKYEEKRKQDKLVSIKAYFDSIAKKHDISYYDFNKIYDPRWLNSTVRIDTAQELMTNFCAAVDNDVDAILSLDSPFENYLLTEYKNGKTISQVVGIDRQMKQAQEEKKRREAEQAEKIREIERMKAKVKEGIENGSLQSVDIPTIEPEEPVLRQTIVPPEPPVKDDLHTVSIWVRGTREQLAKLADLIDEAGLEYGAI